MIRPSRTDDHAFIVHSILKSFSFSHWAGVLDQDTFWTSHRTLLEGLLQKRGVHVDIYANPEDDKHILAFLVREDAEIPIAHSLYVKHAFRDHKAADEKPRIALKLLRHAGMADGKRFEFTFRTAAWDRYRQRHRLNAHFAPELLRGTRKDRNADQAREVRQGRTTG